MRSISGAEVLTFRTLQARLLGLVNAKIRNGEFSERGLAILLGVSQPHLHNVLKGERKLHIPLADAFLQKFQISVTDLLEAEDPGFRTHDLYSVQPDPDLAQLREQKKRPGSYEKRDRSAWRAG